MSGLTEQSITEQLGFIRSILPMARETRPARGSGFSKVECQTNNHKLSQQARQSTSRLLVVEKENYELKQKLIDADDKFEAKMRKRAKANDKRVMAQAKTIADLKKQTIKLEEKLLEKTEEFVIAVKDCAQRQKEIVSQTANDVDAADILNAELKLELDALEARYDGLVSSRVDLDGVNNQLRNQLEMLEKKSNKVFLMLKNTQLCLQADGADPKDCFVRQLVEMKAEGYVVNMTDPFFDMDERRLSEAAVRAIQEEERRMLDEARARAEAQASQEVANAAAAAQASQTAQDEDFADDGANASGGVPYFDPVSGRILRAGADGTVVDSK